MKKIKSNRKRTCKRRICGRISAALLIAAVIAASFLLTACKGSSSKKLFLEAGEIKYEAVMRGLQTLIVNAKKPISTDVDIGFDISGSAAEKGAEFRMLLKKLKLNFKINSQPDKKLLYAGIGFALGSDILNGTFTQDKTSVGVYFPQLDERYFVISDFNRLLGNLSGEGSGNKKKDTEFKPISELDLLLRAKSVLKRYFAHTTASVTKNNVTLENSREIELPMLNETAEKCRVLTFTPAEKDLVKLIEGIASELRNDKDLALLLAYAAGKNPTAKLALSAAVFKDAPADIFNDDVPLEGENDYERILSLLNKSADELMQNAAETAEAIADSGLGIQFVLDKKYRIIKTAVIADNKEVFVHESVKDENTVKFGLMAADDADTYKITGEKTEISKGKYAFNARCEITGEYADCIQKTVFGFKSDGIDFNDKSALGIPYGTLELNAEPEYGETPDMKFTAGKSEEGGSDHNIVLDITDEYGSDMTVTVKIHSTDKPCTAQAPDESLKADISEYTREQIEALMSDFQDFYQSVIMMFTMGGLFG